MSPHLIVLTIVVMGTSLLVVTILMLVQAALVLRVASWFNEARKERPSVTDQQRVSEPPPSMPLPAV